MTHWLEISVMTFLFLQGYTQSIRLVEVRIPKYVIKGSSALLECLYDLDGDHLYSVKWYKDGNEFYRYLPRDLPPAVTFKLPGVNVEVHNSSAATVTLIDVNLQTAGRFRCEVSGEAPSFQTVTEHGDLVVVSLPDQGAPKITGGRPRYQIGDWVRVNCTVGRSKPAVQLEWQVNGEPAEPHTLRRYPNIISGRDSLETSILGLQFRVEQHHFRNGDMKLKCVASLSTLYWRSNEESVEGDRPQKAPVLESRETVYASNSRADPVQANKTDSIVVAHAPSFLVLLTIAALIASGAFEQLLLLTEAIKCKPKLQQQKQEQQQQREQQEKQRHHFHDNEANSVNANQENESSKQQTQELTLQRHQQQQQEQQQQLYAHKMVECERKCKFTNDIRKANSTLTDMLSVIKTTTTIATTTRTIITPPMEHKRATEVLVALSQRQTSAVLTVTAR